MIHRHIAMRLAGFVRGVLGAPRVHKAALFMFVGALVVARFLVLDADPPAHITPSGALYTDEGWYNAAALAAIRDGHWYRDGGFNPAVLLPLFPWLQYQLFELLGVSLSVARILGITCGVLSALGFSLAFRRLRARWAHDGDGAPVVDEGPALGTSIFVLFIANFAWFSFSRLSFMEMPMLCLLSLAILCVSRVRSGVSGWVLLSALALSASALTKTTAISGLPVFVALVWMLSGKSKASAALFLGVFVLPLVAHQLYVHTHFPADVALFRRINFEERISLWPWRLVLNVVTTVWQSRVLGMPLLFVGFLVPWLWSRTAALRVDPMARLALLWLLCGVGLLSLSTYHPPRYQLILAPPLMLLLMRALWQVGILVRGTTYTRLPALILALIVTVESIEIAESLNSRSYTMVNMAQEARELMTIPGTHKRPVVVGEMADTLALVVDVKPVNARLITVPQASMLESARPDFLVAIGTEDETFQSLQEHHHLVFLKSWSVLSDYLHGRKVSLYRIGYETPALPEALSQ